jgi:hypothetical protein
VRGGRATRLAPIIAMRLAIHSQRQWLVQLSTLTVFVWVLAWTVGASAAVPMCGSHAQTIAAPPIGTPASSDALTANGPCDQNAPLGLSGVPQRDAPEKLNWPELPIRALPFLPRFPACPVALRLSQPAAPQHLPTAGFARSIDRPPRASFAAASNSATC